MSHAHDVGVREGPGGLFGVLIDPRAYGAFIYMILSLAFGIFYFTWAVTGIALSIGLFILIIGIPFALLFLGSVRVIGWAEARLVSGLLGADIPEGARAEEGLGFWGRIKAMLADGHTWGTLFYMILMLPLGTIYFTLAVTLGATSFALMGSGVWGLSGHEVSSHVSIDDPRLEELVTFLNSPPGYVVCIIAGAILFLIMLHIARGVGFIQARIAEGLLVR